jgi:hypothetical protein
MRSYMYVLASGPDSGEYCNVRVSVEPQEYNPSDAEIAYEILDTLMLRPDFHSATMTEDVTIALTPAE